jgi:hypothetical protein
MNEIEITKSTASNVGYGSRQTITNMCPRHFLAARSKDPSTPPMSSKLSACVTCSHLQPHGTLATSATVSVGFHKSLQSASRITVKSDATCINGLK